MQNKRIKRAINGVLLLDKPRGISSNHALQKVKWLFQAQKAGHTGTLDPLATGLLPICLGEATKFSNYLLDADKAYLAEVQLGATSTTGDAEGEISPAVPVAVSSAQFIAVLQQFMGKSQQVPPMYSALKHQGKPLYEYARNGVEIARPPREIEITHIALHTFADTRATVEVHCSKGTYIRTLAEDIGSKLGCGAYLAGLRRIKTGALQLNNAVTLEQLEAMSLAERDVCLQPTDFLLHDLPKITLDADSAYYFRQGQFIWQAGLNISGLFRVYAQDDGFIGIAEQRADGKIAPKRLLAND